MNVVAAAVVVAAAGHSGRTKRDVAGEDSSQHSLGDISPEYRSLFCGVGGGETLLLAP